MTVRSEISAPEMQPEKPISKIRTVSLATLGCKLNQAETASLEARFRSLGYELVPFRSPADLAVVNTCTVTDQADRKSRQVLRHAVKTSAASRVAALGCYAQVNPGEIAQIEGVDMILGTQEKYRLFELLHELESGKLEEPLIRVADTTELDTFQETPFPAAAGRTRAFLKIQEGCDYFCSYCIIPFARGRARSRPLADCRREARRLVEAGYRELVLTGINLGTWEGGGARLTLARLLEELVEIPGLDRIRISSIEPNTVTDELLRVIRDTPSICPHLHVPLQSGSPRILRQMSRKYTLPMYLSLVDRIQACVPGCALGTDVMVGFPGESDSDFAATLQVVAEIPFAYLHVFRYSTRTGTAATRLVPPVEPAVKKARSTILLDLNREKRRTYIEPYLGTRHPVLFESASEDGFVSGLTPNYIRVRVPSGDIRPNQLVEVQLLRNQGLCVYGEPV